jgi:tetratricopeptide (TPR) repeat protein
MNELRATMKIIDLGAEIKEIKALAKVRQYATALRRLTELLETHPNEASVYQCSAFVNSLSGNDEAAIRDISAAIALNTAETGYHFMRGTLHFRAACYEKAVADFSEVVKLCDHWKDEYYRQSAHFFRADAHLRLKEFEAAINDCSYVEDGFKMWTDSLRTKEQILFESRADSR